MKTSERVQLADGPVVGNKVIYKVDEKANGVKQGRTIYNRGYDKDRARLLFSDGSYYNQSLSNFGVNMDFYNDRELAVEELNRRRQEILSAARKEAAGRVEASGDRTEAVFMEVFAAACDNVRYDQKKLLLMEALRDVAWGVCGFDKNRMDEIIGEAAKR